MELAHMGGRPSMRADSELGGQRMPLRTASNRTASQVNLAATLQVLQGAGPLSGSAIAHPTGLSVATANRLVDRPVQDGQVSPCGGVRRDPALGVLAPGPPRGEPGTRDAGVSGPWVKILLDSAYDQVDTDSIHTQLAGDRVAPRARRDRLPGVRRSVRQVWCSARRRGLAAAPELVEVDDLLERADPDASSPFDPEAEEVLGNVRVFVGHIV